MRQFTWLAGCCFSAVDARANPPSSLPTAGGKLEPTQRTICGTALCACVMLTPWLLAIPRHYGRRTRPDGEWRFPGLIPGRHLSKDAVELVCREALELAGTDKPIRTLSIPKVA